MSLYFSFKETNFTKNNNSHKGTFSMNIESTRSEAKKVWSQRQIGLNSI